VQLSLAYLVVKIAWMPQVLRGVLTTQQQTPCCKPLFSWKERCCYDRQQVSCVVSRSFRLDKRGIFLFKKTRFVRMFLSKLSSRAERPRCACLSANLTP